MVSIFKNIDSQYGMPHADANLPEHYKRVRHDSEWLCEPLEIEDYGVQTIVQVSPPKWHLAHTSWFFETFLLLPYFSGYKQFNPLYAELFNSYYNSVGRQHPRPERGLLSRPTVKEVYRYREYVDRRMSDLLSEKKHEQHIEIEQRTLLGINHEQQHQELLLTDIKNIFAYNPLRPIYRQVVFPSGMKGQASVWNEIEGDTHYIGFEGQRFAFDNERPRHKVYLNSFRIASRPVTNGEFMEFIDAGGYQRADYWLADAWKTINARAWHAPLYWEYLEGNWWEMTLSGLRLVDEHAPVCHVSYFEAAAYARWVGKRLPTEAEWEIASSSLPVQGNFREKGYLHPVMGVGAESLQQFFGDVWEWTQSPYVAYPGYHQANGAFGEYNGKFMCNQMVLRGGSCVTPSEHVRHTYRNFFYPDERWQFCGFRLAEDLK